MPQIYIDDCVKATIQLLKADNNRLTRRVYNLAGISFPLEEYAKYIKKYIPDFQIEYEPDFRQKIAETWPRSVDDSDSQRDWDWSYNISTEDMVKRVLKGMDK